MSVRSFGRRVLNRRVRVDAVVECAMWLLVPYTVIGLVWGALHPDMVNRDVSVLRTRLPAGAEIAAYGQVSLLWPVLLMDPTVCPV